MLAVASAVQEPLVALVCAGGAAVYLAMRSRKREADQKPPLVGGGLPLVGHLPYIVTAPYDFVRENQQKHGNISRINMMGYEVYLCHGLNYSEKFFTENDKLSFLEGVKVYLGLLMPTGFFKRIRTDVFSVALATSRMKNYALLMEDSIKKDCSSWTDKGTFDVFHTFTYLTLRINILCFAGAELSSTYYDEFSHHFMNVCPPTQVLSIIKSAIAWKRQPDVHFEHILRLVKKVVDERQAAGPVKGKMDVDNSSEANLSIEQRIQMVRDSIEDANVDMSTQGTEGLVDYIQVCIDMVPKNEDGSLDYKEIALSLYTFLFAAQANTYAVASWTLIHILKHPEILRMILDEQRDVIARNGPAFTLKSVDQMTLLNACILEAGRLELSLSAFRKVMDDMPVVDPASKKSYTIPKGALYGVFSESVHFDPTIFAEPEKYDPHRFLAPREEHLKTRCGLMMFGHGAHACIGRKFAVLEIKMIIAHLLREYELTVATEDLSYNKSQLFFVHLPTNPVMIQYKKLETSIPNQA